jgi:hypothetical protein
MKILALDLGTKAGVAHNLGGELYADTWTLASPKEIAVWNEQRITRRQDPRVLRFYKKLCSLSRPDAIIFEDVLFSSYTLQVQLWASLRSAVWLAFPNDVTIESVPVTTLKKFATNAGNADKELMARHLYLQHPEWRTAKLDDNAVDALWLFYWAQHTLSRIKNNG